MVVAFIQKEYILLEMKEILEEAINEFAENSKQVTLDSEASRKDLAEFIENYFLEIDRKKTREWNAVVIVAMIND